MPLDALTEAVFRAAAGLRGGRAFHPDGVAFEATWRPDGDTPLSLLSPTGTHRALVRLSRGVGLPRGLPDVLGVAIRLPDVHGAGRHQDLLLASVGAGRLGRRVLIPARRFVGTRFSTVLAYETPVGRTPLLATVDGRTRSSLALLRTAGDAGMHVHLTVAGDVAVATVDIGRALPPALAEEIRFDPWNTAPGLRPVGLLNRLRRPAYAASQQGRPRAADRPRAGDDRIA